MGKNLKQHGIIMFYTRSGKLKNIGVKFDKSTGENYLIFYLETKVKNVHFSKVLREHDLPHNKKMITEIVNGALDGLPKLENKARIKLEIDILNRVSNNLQ